MSGYAFWDTNLLIYWIGNSHPWGRKVQPLYAWQEARAIRIVTSSLSLGELLVHPITSGRMDLARSYANLIDQIGCLHFGPDEAWRFAELRARYPSLRPPDAIQLACASVFGVEFFFTNDVRLTSLSVSGIGSIRGLSEWTAPPP